MYYIIIFYRKHKKLLAVIGFLVVFFISLFVNLPTWLLGSLLNKYSQDKLTLYNTSGTFWNGSGLLVVVDPKTQHSAPLILLNWKVNLGTTKYLDINFLVGTSRVAEIYLNKNGVNLDSLNMSLSVNQVTELFGLIKNLGLSGNIAIIGNGIKINSKGGQGAFNIKLSAVSSSMSPVNPLGNYNITYNLDNGGIAVSSSSDSNLTLSGHGTIGGLVLNGRINPSQKDKLLQFITVMGLPQPDGSYALKIF